MKNKYFIFLCFSAAIVISTVYAQETPDEFEEDALEADDMPLTRRERDLAVAETAGGGGKGGGAAGGKVGWINFFKVSFFISPVSPIQHSISFNNPPSYSFVVSFKRPSRPEPLVESAVDSKRVSWVETLDEIQTYS